MDTGSLLGSVNWTKNQEKAKVGEAISPSTWED